MLECPREMGLRWFWDKIIFDAALRLAPEKFSLNFTIYTTPKKDCPEFLLKNDFT